MALRTAPEIGHPATLEGMLFTMANHMHEHLGQAIAYARGLIA